MAGRGVDIKIDDEVRELGGLYVLGTERHEARRIDNQLRGRSGRQGDPGETRFYLSGQDDLVRLFAGDRIHNIMERFKLPDDQPMEASILSRQIENAQKKVEEQNFVARKNVLKYDDVMNVQRQVIYEQRNRVLHGEDLGEDIRDEWLPEVISDVVADYTESELTEDWDLGELVAAMDGVYGTGVAVDELKGLDREAIVQEFLDDALDAYDEREKELVADPGRADARPRALHRAADGRHPLARAPREHGLHARGHPPPRDGPEGPARRVPERGPRDVPGAEPRDSRGGRDAPLPRGGDAATSRRSCSRRRTATGRTARSATSTRRSRAPTRSPPPAAPRPLATAGGGSVATPVAPRPKVNSENENIGRNDPCWCGSGKKFKKCHGA